MTYSNFSLRERFLLSGSRVNGDLVRVWISYMIYGISFTVYDIHVAYFINDIISGKLAKLQYMEYKINETYSINNHLLLLKVIRYTDNMIWSNQRLRKIFDPRFISEAWKMLFSALLRKEILTLKFPRGRLEYWGATWPKKTTENWTVHFAKILW